ncbi:MAG: polysaccharide deacetylase family protein [Acidimicrobiia bacterium]
MTAATRTPRASRLSPAIETAASRVFRDREPGRRRVILCYHSIHPTAPYASATPTEFGEQLDWLREHCEVVGLDEIRDPSSRNRPRVALTFDDGYLDNWQNAFPALAARGMSATFFVTVGFIDRAPEVIDRMARLWGVAPGDLDPLRWDQLREMRAAGMHVGSHTVSHPNLAALPSAAAAEELLTARERLEAQLQQAITAVAYPFGKPGRHVTHATAELAGSAGYSCGVTVSPRAVTPGDDPLLLPRLAVGNDDLDQLHAKVVGNIDWHAYVHERAPRSLVRLALFGRA